MVLTITLVGCHGLWKAETGLNTAVKQAEMNRVESTLQAARWTSDDL